MSGDDAHPVAAPSLQGGGRIQASSDRASPRPEAEPQAAFSPRELLRGKRLLLTGASGFLGKVWLAHLLLETQPAEVVVLLRPGRAGAQARLEELLASSPAFRPLHEAHGENLGRVLAPVLRAVGGELSAPSLGLDADELERLRGLDLVVNLAGLTGLDPSLADALAINTDGALAALELARDLGAGLLHVSTAYVAGRRRGRVPETIETRSAPSGDAFDAEQELADLRALVRRVEEEALDGRTTALLEERASDQLRRHGRGPAARERFLRRERDAWKAARMVEVGRERALAWGWPNAYTLTKSLAESLLAQRRGAVPLTVVRPTVVESALRFPFPGWKEGLQTSGPLTWALTHGPLRGLPSRERVVLDVIPVDFVARGLTLAAAALLSGDAPSALHLGSSDSNPLPMQRVIELTSLAHRAHDAKRGWRQLIPDAVATSPALYKATSLPFLRRLAREAGELCELAADSLPDRLDSLRDRSRKLGRTLERTDRRLASLDEAVQRFLPFVRDHDQTFAGEEIRALESRLASEEREAFAADPADLDWRRYWIDVHVPGLREWIYPRLEGKRPAPEPRRPVILESLDVPAKVQP